MSMNPYIHLLIVANTVARQPMTYKLLHVNLLLATVFVYIMIARFCMSL